MPTPQSILENLRLIATDAMMVAALWHVLVSVAAIAIARGWRPSRRRAGVLLALPVGSVSLIAFAYGNPFNGILLGTVAIALGVVATRLGDDKTRRGARSATAFGVTMIVFGWTYPHFLESHAPAIYLVAAPTGVIPCPTLSLVIGFALLSGGLGSRAWSLTLAGAGLFYGLFGALRLGVGIDLVLVFGAAALVVVAFGLSSRGVRRIPVSAPQAAMSSRSGRRDAGIPVG